MARARPVLSCLLAAAALAAFGCGSSASHASAHKRSSAHVTTGGLLGPSSAIPAPAPTGTPANPAAVRVIEAWSSALRRGDIQAAAAYFRVPSELVNGSVADGSLLLVKIRNRAQALTANENLPCGAKFISADQRGQYVNALFRLTGRPGPGGTDCGSGSGATARTNFLIRDGRIVLWIRAPDDPGDNGSPTAPQGSGGGGPVV